jgi:molybdate transport system permease protein
VDTEAVLVTLKLATLTAVLLFAFGVPVAWWLATTTSRWRPIVEATVALPLVLPPTVVGFYVLAALGPDGVVGAPLQALVGARLPFTFAGLLVGSLVFNLPFAVRPFAAAFAAVDRRFVEAAWCTGASRLRTFARVVLPLAAPGLRAGVVLTFAHAVGEFGVVMMIGGNIPGVTRTLSVSIYDDVAALDYARAHESAALLLVFSLVVLALVGRGRARDPLLA